MKQNSCFNLTANNIFYLIGAVSSGLVQGFALGEFGAFQDSKIYYELYRIIGTFGIYESSLIFFAETSKFEPIVILLFAAEDILSGGMLNEYWFLVVNMVLLNVFASSVMLTLMQNRNDKFWMMFFVSFIVMTGYLSYSKILYVWRSVIAFVFFIFYIKENSWKRFIWAALACLTHFSFLLFIVLFTLIEIASRSRNKNILIMLGVGMLGSVFIVQNFPNIFNQFTSGNDVSLFFLDNEEHASKAWISILFSLIVLLLVFNEYMKNTRIKPLFLFCIILIFAGLVSFNSYQFMNRIILPASMIVGFLPFLIKVNDWRFFIARLIICLSIVPTIRLMYMQFTGSFLAM